MPFGKKTAEEIAANDARKAAQETDKAAQKETERAEKELRAYLNSPAGLARSAYERGDLLYQFSIDVMNQQAIIVAMVGSATNQKGTDPTAILNSVCREGWELVNGSFVFVEEGQQSRDKFLASGQNIAVKGSTVGYYLFRRAEQNRHSPTSQVGAQSSPSSL